MPANLLHDNVVITNGPISTIKYSGTRWKIRFDYAEGQASTSVGRMKKCYFRFWNHYGFIQSRPAMGLDYFQNTSFHYWELRSRASQILACTLLKKPSRLDREEVWRQVWVTQDSFSMVHEAVKAVRRSGFWNFLQSNLGSLTAINSNAKTLNLLFHFPNGA